MKRLFLLLMVSVMAPTAPAQDKDKFATVQVTGTIQLPAGATLPAKVRIDVEIAKIEPGQVIIFHKIIGRQEISSVKSTPVQFKVAAPKSHLTKDAKAQSFTLRATIYDMTESKRKKVFETPMNEALQPFTDTLQPKQDVTLPVKAVAAK